jgi:hypothetical protein
MTRSGGRQTTLPGRSSDRARPMPDDARALARRRWYARTLRSLDGLTQDDIIAGWLLRVQPNV